MSEPEWKGKRLFQSSVCPDSRTVENHQGKKSHNDHDSTRVGGPALVATPDSVVCGLSNGSPSQKRPVSATSLIRDKSSSSAVTGPSVGSSRMETILGSLKAEGFSEKVNSTVRHGWRPSTHSVYEGPWTKWVEVCKRLGDNPASPTIQTFTDFIQGVFDEGGSFSKTNTAASSVATAVHITSGVNPTDHPVVGLLRRSIRNIRPPRSSMTETWDVTLVFRWVLTLGSNGSLSRRMLTLKLIVLLKVDLMARGSDLARCFASEVKFCAGGMKVRFYKPKEWRPDGKFTGGVFSAWVYIASYSNKRICSVSTYRYYLKSRPQSEWANDILVDDHWTRCIVSSIVKDKSGRRGPRCKGKYYSLKKDTIANYMVEAMRLAGVPEKFLSHSSRAAAISMATEVAGDPGSVMAHARLSSEFNFRKFYLKDFQHGDLKKVPQQSIAACLRAGV